jgi:hypothetical protein
VHRRQLLFRLGPAQARWKRQAEGDSDAFEIGGHFHIGIVDHIVNTVGSAPAQGGNTGCRQIVGVDVVGVGIVGFGQGRRALFQALQGQAVGGINARCPQDGDTDPITTAPVTQASLGIDPPAGP